MPIDLGRNCVFIHIPRTGGSTIERLFGLTTEANYFSPRPVRALTPATKTPQHFTWQELASNISPAVLRRAYTFAFVRNPWDRFVSEYCWRRGWWLSPRRPDERYYYDARDLATLDAFVRLLELPFEARMDARRGCDGHLEPQLSYIVDEQGHQVVDFLGRFEQLEAGVRTVAKTLNVPVTEVPRVRASERKGDYTRYYSAYSRSAIAEFYKCDIEAFGYVF